MTAPPTIRDPLVRFKQLCAESSLVPVLLDLPAISLFTKFIDLAEAIHSPVFNMCVGIHLMMECVSIDHVLALAASTEVSGPDSN